MKKTNSNLIFMVSVVLIGVILLVVLGVIGKHQQNKIVSGLPTKAQFEKAYQGKVKDFEYSKHPSLGKANAPIKIVEFGDFKCPACKQWESLVLPKIYQDYIYKEKAQFYFINYPFLAEDSVLAAIAGEAVYHQNPDAFWDFYTKIYEKQGPESEHWATEDFLLKFVKEDVPNIDYQQFSSDLKARKYMDVARKDFLIGRKYKVDGTPSIYINGKKVKDISFEGIQKVMDAQLKVKTNE